jgi:hypothetical protein
MTRVDEVKRDCDCIGNTARADIGRELEEAASELRAVHNSALRRTMLTDMWRLLAEADRLLSENSEPAGISNGKIR